MVNAAALLVEEFAIRIVFALDRLYQLQFEMTYLHERLTDTNRFFFPAIREDRAGTIRPFDETERPNTKQRREKLGGALKIRYDNSDLNARSSLTSGTLEFVGVMAAVGSG